MRYDFSKPPESLNSSALPPRPLRRWWLFFLSAFIIFFVILASWYFYTVHTNKDLATLQPKNVGFLDTVRSLFFHSDAVMDGQTDDRVNILLLGVGGTGHDGPFLSDTNIILSIKPSTDEVALISVPRDLVVTIPGHGVEKINSVDAFGEAATPGQGGEYAREFFQQTFNLPIPYYVRVDFTAFKDIINAVGGVTVDVPNGFTDTQYPTDDDGPDPNGYQTIQFDAGVQTMNGETALEYVRSRHGDNGEASDFARSRRQQLVMEALKAKLLSLGTLSNPATLTSIYNSLTTHVTTNLTFSQMIYLISLVKDLQVTHNLVFDNSPGGYLLNSIADNGAYILTPVDGTFDAMNAAIADIFNATTTPTGPAVAEGGGTVALAVNTGGTVSSSVKIEIQNGTWRAGLAARMRDQLDQAGYNVIDVGNSIIRPIDTTQIIVLNPKAAPGVVAALENTFQATATQSLPYWLEEGYDNPSTTDDETGMKYDPDADVLVVLGANTQE